ncbi:AraC family transcriptional regulator [Thermodesulfobacteriota bacterium]
MTDKPLHTISTTLPAVLVRYLGNKGHDPTPLLKSIGIDQTALADPETRFTADQFDALWTGAVKLANERDLGFSYASELAEVLRGRSLISNMMLNSSTVGEAMERLVRYHDIVSDAVRPNMEIGNDGVRIFWEYFGPTVKMPEQFGEALMALYTKILLRLTDSKLVLLEVSFVSPTPENLDKYNELFKAPLRFNRPENKLLMDRECLAIPIFLSDANVLTTLEKLAKKRLEELFPEKPLSSETGKVIGEELMGGREINLDVVAGKLAMSPRSLQFKLKEEGVTYQEILDDLRKQIALDNLKEPSASIADLAFLLGYSDQSAFNHAFKRWTGKTPRQFRS